MKFDKVLLKRNKNYRKVTTEALRDAMVLSRNGHSFDAVSIFNAVERVAREAAMAEEVRSTLASIEETLRLEAI